MPGRSEGLASPAGKGAACGAPKEKGYQAERSGRCPLWVRSSAGQGAPRYKLHDIGVNEPWTIYNISRRTDYCGTFTAANVGQEISVCGWVQRQRNLGSLIFVDLRDRTGLLQLAF